MTDELSEQFRQLQAKIGSIVRISPRRWKHKAQMPPFVQHSQRGDQERSPKVAVQTNGFDCIRVNLGRLCSDLTAQPLYCDERRIGRKRSASARILSQETGVVVSAEFRSVSIRAITAKYLSQYTGKASWCGYLTPMDSTQCQNAFEPLWHPSQAATFLGVHEKTAVKMARIGQIPALRVGKHWRFRRSDLVSWVASRVQSTCQPVP